VGQERLGPSHFFIPLVLGLLNSLVWYVRGRGPGGAHCGPRPGCGPPTAGRVAWRRGPAPALAPFPVPGRSSLWTVSCCWGGWLVLLLRGCDVCSAVSGGLQSGAALICVRLNVLSLPPCSSSPTVTGCRLGGFPVGRDLWGGERIVGGVLPRIRIGKWGLWARLCLVLVCRGRYGLGGGFFSSSWDRVWAE
jgi:hypothetical protein